MASSISRRRIVSVGVRDLLHCCCICMGQRERAWSTSVWPSRENRCVRGPAGDTAPVSKLPFERLCPRRPLPFPFPSTDINSPLVYFRVCEALPLVIRMYFNLIYITSVFSLSSTSTLVVGCNIQSIVTSILAFSLCQHHHSILNKFRIYYVHNKFKKTY
jgi:hypothetical protein